MSVNFLEKKPRSLLHDAADMSIEGISGKVLLVGRDVEEALPWQGGVFHSGKPPVQWQSTRMFLAPSSGDRLKGATPVHNLSKKQRKKFTMPRKRCSCLMS